MLLKISHNTQYTYDTPLTYALQRLRLVPKSSRLQTVISWEVSVEGGKVETRYEDSYGNETWLLSVDGQPHRIVIEALGVVETIDGHGIVGMHKGSAPLWLFQQPTDLSQPGPAIMDLAQAVEEGNNDLDRLHNLMRLVRERVVYTIGATDAVTTAEEALVKGQGVCQDHSHIFLSVARELGFAARYVSGYLHLDDADHQTATHAWAEAYVEGLGWVGFDSSNGICPDERYVRVASGRDYRDAMPVMGVRQGRAEEDLAVWLTVEQ